MSHYICKILTVFFRICKRSYIMKEVNNLLNVLNNYSTNLYMLT